MKKIAFICIKCKTKIERPRLAVRFTNWLRCKKCKGRMERTDGSMSPGVLDLTKTPDYYKKKRFMHKDKNWKEDIKSRRTLKDGTIGRFDSKGKRTG